MKLETKLFLIYRRRRMKAILMSIKPEWVEKILSGEKTVEIRKTRPKLDTPFKVYIYCTKDKSFFLNVVFSLNKVIANNGLPFYDYTANGKVVAEFTCDKIGFILNDYYNIAELNEICEGTCLKPNQFLEYMGNGIGCYKWYISDLKIYDKPKELTEFKNVQNIRGYHKQGETSIQALMNGSRAIVKTLTIPPRSWYYVEEL